MTVTLVLGGQRSGKSAFAEQLLDAAPQKLYIATAEAGDGEMTDRIALHQARRGEGWQTVEAPLNIAGALAPADGRAVLLDCVSMWVANLLGAEKVPLDEMPPLIAALASTHSDVVLVSSEVGLGIIPDNALARAYADALGSVNQHLAVAANRVILVTAGLPHTLKDDT